jgi:hypothetical protein
MSKIYKGSSDNSQIFVIIVFLGTFMFFGGNFFSVPSPLNYPLLSMLVTTGLILIIWIAQINLRFYIEVNKDDSIRIVKGRIIPTISLNSFKSIGKQTANIILTKDNIIDVYIPSMDDRQKIWKWLPQRTVFTINPIEKLKYNTQILKNINSTEFDDQKGFGPYSIAFVSNTHDLVAIKVNSLLVQYCMGEKMVIKEYSVENAMIFVSIKNPQEFVNSYRK